MSSSNKTTNPQEVLIEYLKPNPWQPRQSADESKLKILAETIRRYGFSGYLEARRDPLNPDKLQLVFGHRRCQAAEMAGLTKLPIVLREYDDRQMAELALLENHTQEEISYYDEGLAFIRMQEEHDYGMRDLAKLFGVSLGYITNRIAIARLPKDSPLVAAAKHGQADMTSLLMLRNLERDLTADSLNELLDAAIRHEISADQLKRVRAAVKQVNDDLHLVDEATGRRQHTVTVDRVKHLDEQAREQRKSSQEADERRYRDLVEAERVLTVVRFDEVDLVGDHTAPAPSSEAASPNQTTVRYPPLLRESEAPEKSADAPPRGDHDWDTVLTLKLRETTAMLLRQDPEIARHQISPALQEELQHALKVLLRFRYPSRHRLKQLRRRPGIGAR